MVTDTCSNSYFAYRLPGCRVERRYTMGDGLEVRRQMKAFGAGLAPSAQLLRSALARMTTPLLPDDYLHMINPLWSARELRGRVVTVKPETDDAATLVIK